MTSVVQRILRRQRLIIAWVSVAVIYATLVVAYGLAIHPWFMNRGATAAEQSMRLPGDEIRPDPRWQTTRALTIEAPADVVWAWLIQHGQDRAGFYSYDWLENLVGADIHNHDSLHEEWQNRDVGDRIPMAGAIGRLIGDESTLRVHTVEHGRALVGQATDGGSGAYVLIPLSDTQTRLLFRDRVGKASDGSITAWLADAYRWIAWDPMHYVMQHQMMVGIERRAEGRATPGAWLGWTSRTGWYAAAAILAAGLATVARRRWLILPLASMLPAILLAADPDAAIAAFLATGITVFGAIRYGRYWWPGWALIAAAVFLTLLLAPDAYVAFGLALLGATCAGVALRFKDAWQSNAGSTFAPSPSHVSRG